MNIWVTDKDIAEEMLRGAECKIPGFKKLEETEHFRILNSLFLSAAGDVETILDLGCGAGELGRVYKFFDYTGADLPHVIDEAAKIKNPNLRYFTFNAYASDFKFAKEYDIIITNAFISELISADIVLEKLLQNAKKYVIIHRQKYNNSAEQNVTYEKYRGYLGKEYTSAILSETYFKLLLEKHSFEVVSTKSSNTPREYSVLIKKRKNDE